MIGLKEKLKRELKSDEQSHVDWVKRKNDWIASVDELNTQIQDWFGDFKEEGLVEFELTRKSNTEEYIGSYEVNVLHLNFTNGREVIVEPMGTLIIGAWARFDIFMRGYNSGRYYILRDKDKNGNFSWSIANPDHIRDIKPLNKVILEEIFDKWLI